MNFSDTLPNEVVSVVEVSSEEMKEFMEKYQAKNAPSANNNGGSTDYYKLPPNCTDCQDIIEWRKMNFAQGNIMKAVFCFNIPRGTSSYLRDLNKIIWFAQREINRILIEEKKKRRIK